MLWGYKYQQSTHPLPNTYTQDQGIQPAEFIRLAQTMGLRTIPQINQSLNWTFLESLLQSHGPLWCAGQWNGPNHIIVVTGVELSGVVYVNDPAFAAPVNRDIAWFNAKIDKNVSIPIMYLP